MKSLVTLKKYIGAVFLFFFLFSANAVLHSSHFVEEIGHDGHLAASHSGSDDQGSQHDDGTSCCDSHSHVSILYQPLSYSHSPRLLTQLAVEPFRFIPEVYLDKFIPPQNLS